MTRLSHKIAILHDDDAIVDRVRRVASGAGLEIVRAQSFAGLSNCLSDPYVCGIVTDLPTPRQGGLHILEELRGHSSRTQIIVITATDKNGLEVAAGEVAAKGMDVTIISSKILDETRLARQLCRGRDQSPDFGPADLDDCIQDGHLRIEYQPKVSLLTTSESSQFGVEALCRVRDPRFGAISPDKFIPMAEKCGLIAKLSDAVACQALRDWQSWKSAGLCIRLALNVSPLLLGDANWYESFLARCAEFRMEPKWITLEITETAAGATSNRATEILTALHRKGFALSIDDFGTGFSSLATLYRLPIAEMKIDKSFVLDLQVTAGARNLVESAVGMAKRMGIKVVAEGVETESVFHELRKMGCHEVQGFFVGKSMPADAVVPFFTGWRKTSEEINPSNSQKGLPKVAIIQALLNEIMNDRSLETRLSPSGPYADRTNAIKFRDDSKDLIRKVPPLVLEGKTLASLGLCHKALQHLRSFPSFNDMRVKIAQLQSLLEEELLTRENLEIHSAQGMFRLVPRDSVTLGRVSSSSRVDIPVKCRWFSKGEKNLRIFESAGNWFIEDLGSAHGHFVDESRLVPRRPYELSSGRTLVHIRLASGAIAPLSVLLERPSFDQHSLIIGFEYDADSLRAELGDKEWSELKDELAHTWIIFNGKVSIGASSGCTLTLDNCGSPIAATIEYANGYWISPTVDSRLAIDGTIFEQSVPLAAAPELAIGDSRILVRELAGNMADTSPRDVKVQAGKAPPTVPFGSTSVPPLLVSRRF